MAKKKLSSAAKRARAAYQKDWAARNPKRVQRYQQNYWEKKAVKIKDDTLRITVKDSVTKDNVTCQECEKPFKPRRSTARFCSDKCRVKYYRKHL